MNKTLRKAIMLRSKLKNRARDIKMYKQQRNLVVRLNKDSKFSYFSNLDIRNESTPFWNACKPYFTNKHSRADTSIMLVEKEELVLSEKKICSIFNTYFGNIVQSLNLFQWSGSLLNNQRLCVKLDKTDATILKYQHHPSIKMIKKRFPDLLVFNFQAVSVADVKEIIMELKTDNTVSGEIPVNLLKDCDFSFHALTNCINESIENGTFPDSLKEANIAPVCKSKNPFEKSNYRPVSILPLLSKVYERICLSSYRIIQNTF